MKYKIHNKNIKKYYKNKDRDNMCYLNEMRELYSFAGMCKGICCGLQRTF